MRGGARSVAVVGAAMAVFAAAACGGDDGTTADAAGSGSAATSAAQSPAPACSLVSEELVSSTFGVTARVETPASTSPFQDGKEYSCQFHAEPVWSLSVSVRVFTAPLSVDDLVDIGVSRQQFATKVSGVGDGAAYVKRSSLIQFVAVEKSGDQAKLVLLLGTSGTSDEARFSAIAKESLKNAPNFP